MNAQTHPPIRPIALLTVLLITVVPLLALAAGLRAADDYSVRLPFVTVPVGISAEPRGRDFSQVVGITHAGDERLFITERTGLVKILHPDGRITTFLDITDRVTTAGVEFGAYELRFDPDYATPGATGNGLFYLTYTGVISEAVYTTLSRFRVSADPDLADPASEAQLFRLRQIRPVHKGGGLDFDETNRLLYVGIGDDWQAEFAQDPTSYLGKVLMFDLSAVAPEVVGDQTGLVQPVIWAGGFRNPYRVDVDPRSGTIYVADVGEANWEEVNLVSLAGPGQNFGWPCLEASDPMPGYSTMPICVDLVGSVPPVYAYPHTGERCAIIGGAVLPSRGPGDPLRYTFGDMCSREIFLLTKTGSGWQGGSLGELPNFEPISGMGLDAAGNAYAGLLGESQPIYQLQFP